MKAWKMAALTAVVVAAAAVGAAVRVGAAVTPAAQEGSKAADLGEVDRMLQVVTGRGSQIGVSIRDVEEEDVKRAKLPSPAGVLIEDVREGSPAEKAGLSKGDIVIEFDGERVRSARQFTRLVQETPPDRQVQAALVRDGQRMTVSVQPRAADTFGMLRDWGVIRAVPPTPPAPPARPAPAPHVEVFPRFEQFFGSPAGRLGIGVERLSDQLAEYFGTKTGVLVSSVADDSAAARAGLRAGDVITALNGSEVSSPSDLSRRIQRLEAGDEFTLEIVREKKAQTLKGKVEERQPRRSITRTTV